MNLVRVIAEKWVSGESVTADEIQEMFDFLNTGTSKRTIKFGCVVMYSLMREYDVRRREGVTRYQEFVSAEEAEEWMNSNLISRNGKWEWGYITCNGWYVKTVTQDYKGDYGKLYYSSDVEGEAQKAADKIMEAASVPVEEKYFVGNGEIFQSKWEAWQAGCHPENVVCVEGKEAATMEAAKQSLRITQGTFGD